MDILISSNLERLIYLSTDCNPEKTAQFMEELSTKGEYTITEEMKARMSDFIGGFASQEINAQAIRKLYEDFGYVIDTHTGVACAVYHQYRNEQGDDTKTVIASTASPYKFSKSVMEALKGTMEDIDEFEAMELLHKTSGVGIPQAVEEIRSANIRHNTECDIPEMKQVVSDILGL